MTVRQSSCICVQVQLIERKNLLRRGGVPMKNKKIRCFVSTGALILSSIICVASSVTS